MPSPIAHGSLVLLVRAWSRRNSRLREALGLRPGFFLIAAIGALWAPDGDFVLGFLFPDVALLDHGGATHSLVFGLLVGLVFSAICRGWYGRLFPLIQGWLIGAACAWSHSLMDFATWGDRGIMMFWPFSSERYITVPLFVGVHRSEPWAWKLHLSTLVTELAFGALVWWLARKWMNRENAGVNVEAHPRADRSRCS